MEHLREIVAPALCSFHGARNNFAHRNILARGARLACARNVSSPSPASCSAPATAARKSDSGERARTSFAQQKRAHARTHNNRRTRAKFLRGERKNFVAAHKTQLKTTRAVVCSFDALHCAPPGERETNCSSNRLQVAIFHVNIIGLGQAWLGLRSRATCL